MTAYRNSFHTVTKIPYYLLFGAPCPLPIDCMHKTLQNHIFATPRDYVGNLKKTAVLSHISRIKIGVRAGETKKLLRLKSFWTEIPKWGPGLAFQSNSKTMANKEDQIVL